MVWCGMLWYGMVWGGNGSVHRRGQWDGRKGGRMEGWKDGRVERMAEEEGGREEGRGGTDGWKGREDGRDWCCWLDV